MSVNAIGGVTGQVGVSSPLQESQETRAMTLKEAANGDRQAMAKLAREQEHEARQNAQVKVPGKSGRIDLSA